MTKTVLSDSLPATWSGGRLDGLEPPLLPDWYIEAWHAHPDLVTLLGDWAPLEALAEADPPEVWGTLGAWGPGAGPGGGGGGTRAPTEVVEGRIARVARDGGGIQLEGDPGWLNASRFSPVDLSPLQPGDEVRLEVQISQQGRRYVRALRRGR